MKLGAKECQKFDHISDEEIQQDIDNTQREVDQYEKELEALRGNLIVNRVQIYMTEGRILKRKEFIEKLNSIKSYRKAKNHGKSNII